MAKSPKKLTAENIFDIPPKTKEVEIPSLGGTLTVRQMLIKDQIAITEKDPPNVFETSVWLAIRCVVDPDLTEDRFEQVKGWPSEALGEIEDAIAELGGEAATAEAAEKTDEVKD